MNYSSFVHHHTTMHDELWLLLVNAGYPVTADNEEENDYVTDFHPYNHRGEFVGDFLVELGFERRELPDPGPGESAVLYEGGPVSFIYRRGSLGERMYHVDDSRE